MARIAVARPPASPKAKSQVVRREKILRSAAKLGARHGLDGMQMYDVAKDAGVAVGTVYRYFPSKTHLFTAVMAEEVFGKRPAPRAHGADPVQDVADLLVGWTRQFMLRPQLAVAMVQSALAAYASPTPEAVQMDDQVAPLILRRLGVLEPDDEDVSTVRLLVYSWWGLLISTLSGHMTQAQTEADLRLGAALLLARFRTS
jgi:AcrR family transcriptional regulator